MSADLHVHTNHSDGTETPEQVVARAAAIGLKTIALTDHDGVDGIAAAQQAGREQGVEVVPGIEFTTESAESEIHILGYYFDPANQRLQQVLITIQTDRVRRIYKIARKLQEQNVTIDPEEVLALAGRKAPGRPHVARLMVAKGIVSNFKEAFNRYLDWRAPAYVPHYQLKPAEAVALISEIGGIAVFAHPLISDCDEIIPQLLAVGLRGLEVYYPGYTNEQLDHYLSLAKQHGLLVTGGSDYHGPDSGREVKLGEVALPDELMDNLRNEYLRRN